MAWLILHRCSDEDSEPRPYALMKRQDVETGKDITIAVCTGPCKERLFFLGHEMFNEAHTTGEAQGSHMPPGFVIARAPTT